MTISANTGVLILALATGVAGCDGKTSSPIPSAPSPTLQHAPPPTPPAVPAANPVTLFGYVFDTAFRGGQRRESRGDRRPAGWH